MAQNENYSQVDLRVGTEAQFNAKVDTLPEGTLFGITDSTVSKADLSTDLKNEINGKINKPANPTSDSAVVINSSGTISTKPLTSITGKSEVAVQGTTPTGDEILWINPNGTSGGGGSSGGGKLYRHVVNATLNNSINDKDMSVTFIYYRSDTKSFKTAFDNQDYSVIKDLKYGTVILRFYRPDNDTAPCQGIGNLADMSQSGNSSPNISNDDIYGVIYTLSGSFYYLMSYPMIVKEVSSEDITEV